MAELVSRELTTKIAKWLVGRERRSEAVALLCVGAISGANDEAGQALLAEAFRLEPNADIAKAAFKRMEGGGEAHPALDEAVAKYSKDEIAKLEREVSRPQFMRAQVGFNNNVKYKDKTYHVQTEDSGIKLPHVITHCFADGGRIIKTHKRSYADMVDAADVGPKVRALMKAQHMEMVMALREGRFDEVIAGRVAGGVSVLTEAPQVDMQQLAKREKGKSEEAAPAAPPKPAVAAPAKSAPVRFHLAVLRSKYGGPQRYEPPGDEVILGAKGGVPLTGEKFCHATEAVFRWKNEELWVEDLDGGNGIFLRIRRPVELELGDEFIAGLQMLRVERNPEPDSGPDPGPTYMWTSPLWQASSFRVAQVLEGGALGEVRMAGGNTLQIGREIGDMVFANDPFLEPRHCWVEEQAGVIVLADMMSKSGVFARIRGEQRLLAGDELMVGRTLLRVEIPRA
jgi:hypothetical protein